MYIKIFLPETKIYKNYFSQKTKLCSSKFVNLQQSEAEKTRANLS